MCQGLGREERVGDRGKVLNYLNMRLEDKCDFGGTDRMDIVKLRC